METNIADVIAIIEDGRRKAYQAINTAMVEAYWMAGKRTRFPHYMTSKILHTFPDENIFHTVCGNIRDFASINELAVLSNLETLNAEMIKSKTDKNTRYAKLKEIAAHQLEVLSGSDILKSIKKLDDSTYVSQQKNCYTAKAQKGG